MTTSKIVPVSSRTKARTFAKEMIEAGKGAKVVDNGSQFKGLDRWGVEVVEKAPVIPVTVETVQAVDCPRPVLKSPCKPTGELKRPTYQASCVTRNRSVKPVTVKIKRSKLQG